MITYLWHLSFSRLRRDHLQLCSPIAKVLRREEISNVTCADCTGSSHTPTPDFSRPVERELAKATLLSRKFFCKLTKFRHPSISRYATALNKKFVTVAWLGSNISTSARS